jgi:multiple sugar transport system substrate-binding protein
MENIVKRKAIALILAIFTASAVMLPGCASGGLDPKNPITLTMWHNLGGESQKGIDALLDEFNSTAGMESGIIINVTAVTSGAELAETLTMIANGDPGAPELPDLAVCYPSSAIRLQQQGRLANLDEYFTDEELSAYVPAFVQEGRFGDGGLYVFPFSKSTDVVYLNQTLFDRFAAESDVTMECFETFEGIAQASRTYYEWTDEKTPDVPGDGKQFFAADSWLNLAQTGARSLGEDVFDGGSLNLSGAAYRHIWDTFYEPAVLGGVALYDGYSSDLHKTGDLIASTGSSAGIVIYSDSITYPDNSTEKVEYSILPFPVFEGGRKIALQRGAGICVAASEDAAREQAVANFLKWFTEPERNTRFLSSTGYLPVTKEAFESELQHYAQESANIHRSALMKTFIQTHAEYEFYAPEIFAGYDELAETYESEWIASLSARRDDYIQSGEAGGDTSEQSEADGGDISEQSEAALGDFMSAYRGK